VQNYNLLKLLKAYHQIRTENWFLLFRWGTSHINP